MSYTRRFSRDITIYYSGSVSYPASQSGGTRSYSGSKTETVVFEVTVDTDPFDEEVDQVNHHVDLLTGSVVATEAAHVKTIYDTSQEVGDTIISGFFNTVRSDVSQQITELKTRTEALLLQLNKLAQRCNDKKRQMGEDYRRIAERYTKIFSELNKELENRIYSIDEPVFHASRTMDEVGSRSVGDAMVPTVSITAGEQARLHSMLAGNIVKKQAVNAIDKGKQYLFIQYRTDSVLAKCLRPGGEAATLTTPFCVMESNDSNGAPERNVYASPLLANTPKDELAQRLNDRKWSDTIGKDKAEAIGSYFRAETANEMQQAGNEHDRRVAELTAKLFDLSKTAEPDK